MSDGERELLSVLILHYNNGEIIYETLESVMSQTYPRIEIVICDDCSKNFPREDIEKWITEHRTPNIENVIVHRNEENVGTVRNMEIAVSLSNGRYLTQIAADDAFYSETVFTTFIDELERLGPDAMFVTGQAAMMNLDMTHKINDFLTPEDKDALVNLSSEEMFERLSVRCFVPAVNFWRRELKDRVGIFSDRYRLIEDWTKSLRMARMGIRMHYLDEYVLKHRDGGVSHGNKKGVSQTYVYYVHDYLEAYKHEILPYIDSFDISTIEDILRNYSWWISVYKSICTREEKTCRKDRQNSLVTRAVKRVLSYTINILKSIYDTISSK